MNPAAPDSASDERDRADMMRLAEGNHVALNDLMERHGERLFRYLIRCLQNEDDAADLTQETFVRVYQHRTKFDGRQRFSTWLYAIATNLVHDQYRWRTRHPQVSLDAKGADGGTNLANLLPEPKPSPDEKIQVAENAEAVRRAIVALPDDLRIPLVLAEYEDRSQAEIGEILGCTPKAVETRIYRARQQLRVKLSKWLA